MDAVRWEVKVRVDPMELTAKLADGVSCDGVHEADDDAGRQLKTRRSLDLENVAVNPHRLTPPSTLPIPTSSIEACGIAVQAPA